MTSGGGTFLYPNAVLRNISLTNSMFAFAATEVGLTTVETVAWNGDDFVANEIQAVPPDDASCVRGPVALAVEDVDGDSNQDVLVLDPCGNWLALGDGSQTFEAHSWGDFLPEVTADLFLADFSWPTYTGKMLAALDNSQASIISSSNLHDWDGPMQIGFPQPTLSAQVTDVAVPSVGLTGPGSNELLVQGSRMLTTLPLDQTDSVIDVASSSSFQQTVTPPYLVPFDGFDHLAVISAPGCSTVALSVSVLVNSFAGTELPRTSALLTFGAGSYNVQQLETSYDDATTLSIIRQNDSTFVGMYGTRDGATVFELWRLSGCTQLEMLAELPVEFDWRTPAAPAFGVGQVVPKTNGVELVAEQVGDELWFAYYDGFDVRLVRALQNTGGWTLAEQKYEIHATRSDLSLASGNP